MTKPYDLVEHRHRFSVWAAARAAQRKLKGATVDLLRDALEHSGVVAFITAPPSYLDQQLFDERHRAWCQSIVDYLASRGVPASFGRAAKLIAAYLKVTVILDSNANPTLASLAHPPIDAILLRNISKASVTRHANKRSWQHIRWTSLTENEYYALIKELRTCVPNGEPFWKLEEYWTVTDQE